MLGAEMYDSGQTDWLTIAQILGALSPFLLLFISGFRAWVGKQWGRVFVRKASHAELSAMRDKISQQLAEGFAQFHREIEAVADQLGQLLDGVGGVSARIGLMESMLKHNADRDERIATVYCDEDGGITFVSRALGDWMDCDRDELMGMRWLRFVEPSHRQIIRDDIPRAKLERRHVGIEIHMGPDGEKKRPYLFALSPMPENAPVSAWVGYFRPAGINPYITDRQQ